MPTLIRNDRRPSKDHCPRRKVISPKSLSLLVVCSWFATSLVFAAAAGCRESEVTLDDLDIGEIDAASLSADLLGPMPEILDLEKSRLKFGFIKLTDCAPLVIAKEKGFFSDEGLNVALESQANWKVLLDGVAGGQLDGAHMLAGQPIGATIGIGFQSPIITAYSLDYNGNAITVSNRVWQQMQENDPRLNVPEPDHPITAKSLKPTVDSYLDQGKPFKMGMVFPVSAHNYELRYWLASAGIHPGFYTPEDTNGMTDAELQLSVTPPPNMPMVLENGTIKGYCVGEPWNQLAVIRGIGVPVTTNYDIWKDNPEKVFGVSGQWAEENPNTHLAIIKALIRAGKWLDETSDTGELVNRREAAEILSRPAYVGADVDVIGNSMTGTFAFQETDVRPLPDFNVFFKHHASYPHYSDCIWFLTQMRRWGQISESKPASWYAETAEQIYKPAIYRKAAEMLVAEGKLSPEEIPPVGYDGYRPKSSEFIDGNTYDARDPIGYINSFDIGNKDDEALAER